ncbi:MAG: hypothetical protein ABNH27_08215 [Alcanivorax sp.]|jgi:heptose-I-phosphate ethanolaminephosphotransferase|uniref:hypothetical protein n=1 Tax=Alcanivorax TaxID=59753 RepID=UPI0023538A33|nr:hypothetical protein [Alcanivorax jadensis]|tara:strand:+ start:260 stop:502 length:243 start_codon:yes stop_codon:yes gene_type:complete
MRDFARRYPLFWVYLFFLYFSAVPQLLIHLSGMSGTVGLRQALIMSLLWGASLVGFSYWLVFGQDFSQSVIFIIFESNAA